MKDDGSLDKVLGRRRVFDNKAAEKISRRKRHKNASKGKKREVTAAVVAIRADPDPLTKLVKDLISARRMAEAEYEGIEFVLAARHEPRALRVLNKLWPFQADSYARRLAGMHIGIVLDD